jgi:transposase-like protein
LHDSWRYKRNGFFLRLYDGRRIRRFICHACGVSFSSQSFQPDYYLKRPDILPQLMTLSVGAMANRQIADHLGVSPSTIDRQLQRLGRQCLLFHAEMMKKLETPQLMAIDGFESFELSQYYPFDLHTSVAPDSGFFLWYTDSPRRRKGAMTPEQKERRKELESLFGRPDPQAVRKDVQELLETLIREGSELTLRSDDHTSYRPAIRAIRAIINHEVTPSKAYRSRHNQLFEINLLDGLIRHGEANHRRETWAWAKRRGMTALRIAVFLVWRNYIRRRWKKGSRSTPAMQIGLTDRPLKVEEIIGTRLFVARVGLKGRWAQYYWGLVQTPALGVNRMHRLTKAA